MKRCPFCAEEIQDAAVKCKHCGERLAPRAVTEDDLDKHVMMPGLGASVRYDTLDNAATEQNGPTILGGQYRILKKLGKGGMGVVYLAEDMEMGDRLVAIKVLPPELSDSVRAVENLRREAITAINLTHPNISHQPGGTGAEPLVAGFVETQGFASPGCGIDGIRYALSVSHIQAAS